MTLKPEDLTDGQDPMTYDEINYLRRLANRVPRGGRILNIGADRGISTLAFLEQTEAVIFSIDVRPCNQERENAQAAGHDPNRIVRLLGRSHDIGQHWPWSWAFNLIFVDGDHSEAGVRADIETWLPRLWARGVIAFHDYMEHPPANNPGGAYQAVNDLIRDPDRDIYQNLGTVDRLIAFEYVPPSGYGGQAENTKPIQTGAYGGQLE